MSSGEKEQLERVQRELIRIRLADAQGEPLREYPAEFRELLFQTTRGFLPQTPLQKQLSKWHACNNGRLRAGFLTLEGAIQAAYEQFKVHDDYQAFEDLQWLGSKFMGPRAFMDDFRVPSSVIGYKRKLHTLNPTLFTRLGGVVPPPVRAKKGRKACSSPSRRASRRKTRTR